MGFWSRWRERRNIDRRKPKKSRRKTTVENLAYERDGNKYFCRSCGFEHDRLPYICDRCGELLRKKVLEKDLEDFYQWLAPQFRPDKEIFICQCGRRFADPDAKCISCKRVTRKSPALPVPNFDVVSAERIRCMKCLRTFPLKKQLKRRAMCSACGNHLLVVYPQKIFTDTRAIIPDVSFTKPSKHTRKMAHDHTMKLTKRRLEKSVILGTRRKKEEKGRTSGD